MRTLLSVFLMMLFYVCVTSVWAQEAVPVIPISDEYIREWLVLGPFFPDDLDTDFLADAGGEANINPREADAVTTADGETLTWKRYKSKRDIISLLDAVGDHEYATAYAFCILQTDAAREVDIGLGNDDGGMIWINGKQVHSNPGGGDVTLDRHLFEANLKAGANRCLIKVSQGRWGWGFAIRVLPPNTAVISGIIVDEKGNPIPNASVRVEQDGEEIAQTTTYASGNYKTAIYPVRGRYDLSATQGERGDWQLGIRLDEGERRTLDLTLKEAISIEGALLMLDDATPHVAVPVEAIRGGKVMATTLSDERGEYQFIHLKPGRYQVRCQVLNGYVYYEKGGNGRRWEYEEVRRRGSEEAGKRVSEENQDGSASPSPTHSPTHPLTHSPKYPLTRSSSLGTTLRVEAGKPLKGISFRFAPFKKGTWRNYSPLDGLADNQVNVIYRDPDGVLWFGTRSGVSRYDGREFVNLMELEIRAIYRDPDGVMWFATEDGVYRYDGKEFTSLTTEDGLISNSVNAISRDPDGIMWFGTGETIGFGASGGLSRYDGRGVTMGDSPRFVNFTTKDGLPNNSVMAIYRDPDGVLWLGTMGGGVSRYDGRGMGDFPHFVNFTTKDGLASDYVIAIHRDPDGVLWFGTLAGGVSRYDGRGMGDFPHFVNFTTKDGLASNMVGAIYRDPDGVLWFGTGYPGNAGNGVSRYDGRTFVNFTTQDGLANDTVRAIYRDPDGVLWFGTRGGSISRYDARTFVNLTVRDGLANNSIRDIYRDPDDMIWFGTYGGGVSRYDGRGMGDFPHFVNFTTQDGLANNAVTAIHRDSDGALWFGTHRGGVSRYDGKTFVNFTPQDGLAWYWISAIHSGSDGALWFGAYRYGVSRYDGKEFVTFTQQDGLPSSWVDAIYGDTDGIMWFGTDSGVSRYDGRGMGDFPHFVNFTTQDGLVDDRVGAIYRDPDGTMWFGTLGGVSRYDGRGMGDFPHFISFTTRDGLANNRVTAICRDSDGTLWFGTEGSGVSRYDGIAWTSLDTRDGLAGNNVSSIQEDADGSLLFGTEAGVTRYRSSTTRPRVCIASVQVRKELYTDLAAIPAITIGSDINIECSAIDFKTVPEKRQYRYRIDEVGARHASPLQWRRPTKSAQFEWAPEKAGTYTFEVQAIDRDLNYSDPAGLEITILPPPFYTRAGFIIGAILAAFFVPTGVYTGLLVRQKKQAFEPIPNPYIVGNPIRSKEMFFGREDDFEFVRAKLGTGEAGLVIVFAGERRSGKTSILFQILNGRLGEQFVPVLIDMQAMAVSNEAEFFEKIASEINSALGQRLELAPTAFREDSPIRAFERFIAQAMVILDVKALLLALDEYELIEAKIDDGVLRPDLITFFASLLEAHPRLSFIFTGSRHLEQRNPTYWHILIGKSLYRHISFLSQRDVLRLITEPVRDQVVYPRGIPERIVRLTAGQPFYTQVVCQNMMDRLNEVQRNRVRQEDVEVVAQELADNPLPQMIYFWDGLEPEQQSTLSLLGEVLEGSGRYASAQMLVDFAQEQNLGLVGALNLTPLPELERVLDHLFVHEVLERERAGEGQYEYRFRVDLFRLWVRQAHSVWQQRA